MKLYKPFIHTSTRLAILAFVFSLTSCRPPIEEIARTMVAATDKFESAFAVALQKTQTAQPSETPRPTENKLTTDVPTETPRPTENKLTTDVPTEIATDAPAATTATRAAHDTLATIAAITVPERNLRQIAIRLGGHVDIPVTVSAQPADHRIGDIIEFSATNLDTDEQFSLPAELIYASPLVLFFAEPHLQVQRTALQPLMQEFEQIIIPRVHNFFGHEWSPGIDGDPRIYILYAEGMGKSVAGYYSPKDEYSQLAHEYSNEKEMFYLNADIMEVDDQSLPGTLAHEFQHMVHWANDSNEETWMNEGASMLSELLTGHTPWGADRSFASDPDLQLNAWSTTAGGTDSIRHYGAAFLFLYYFLERFGETATQMLVAHPANGLRAIDATLQQLQAFDAQSGNLVTANAIFADWVIANYLGDTTWADGRYGYHDYADAPRVLTTAHLACSTPSGEMSVHQYAADYITIDCPSATIVNFSGDTHIHSVPARPHSGNLMFWGNRQDSSDTTLTRAFDLTQVSSATLSYWAWWALEENYDYAYLIVSRNGGKSWEIIETSGGTGENPSGNNLGWGYNYNSGGAIQPVWVHESVDLSPFAGEHILVRFEYLTDAAINWPGILLDDITLPEIGYAEDFELGTGGWDSRGWIHFDNTLPQHWLIQVIAPDTRTVHRIETTNGIAQINIMDGDTIVVSALTPYTTEMARYRMKLY